MGKVDKIKHEVEALSPQKLVEFRHWFVEFDAKAWDRQIEKDVQAGKLNAAADNALKAFHDAHAQSPSSR